MKNSKMIKKLLVAMGIVTSVTAVASVVEAKKISDETKKKCEKIQGRNTYSSLFLFGKNVMAVKENVDVLFPSAILGTNEVDFTQNPLKKEIYVDYKAVLGSIVLRVPKNVKVICDDYDYEDLGNAVEVPQENDEENTVELPREIGEEENATTIYVKGTELGGSLKIVRG